MHPNVQSLIERASTVLARGMPEAAALHEIQQRMDLLEAEDFELSRRMVGLSASEQWFSDRVHRSSELDLGLFILPRGSSLPLHGHPLMTVWMRVLWGSLQIKAYDWAEEYPWTGLARCSYERSFNGADGTLIVQSHNGNVHQIEAHEDCVFLDLLAPPYAEAEGRPCHNYREEKAFYIHGETLVRLVRV
jgi:hypothetical protein